MYLNSANAALRSLQTSVATLMTARLGDVAAAFTLANAHACQEDAKKASMLAS